MIRRAAIRSSVLGLAIAVTLALAVPAQATASVIVRPHHGPPGTAIVVKGTGWVKRGPCLAIEVTFTDASGTTTFLGSTRPTKRGRFMLDTSVPTAATSGAGTLAARQIIWIILAHRCEPGPSASTPFRVTS